MEQNLHTPNPSLRPKGVTPREWRRRQNTKFVGRIRARRDALELRFPYRDIDLFGLT